jgi:hypothetical protein
MSSDDVNFPRWIRDNRELLDSQYFNQKGVYAIEYETKKAYFMSYDQFVTSKFNVIMNSSIAKHIIENSDSPHVLAVIIFQQNKNPKLYPIPTPPPYTQSKIKSPFSNKK